MEYNIIAPLNHSLNDLLKNDILPPFNEEIIQFISAVSDSLLKDQNNINFPELISLGFWMRKANLFKFKKHFESNYQNKFLVGRGLVFHIAPSNVDTIFVYSLFISLLVGNLNIIRVSSKDSEQVNRIISSIQKLILNKNYNRIAKRFLIIKYDHNDNLTKKFSDLCDVRVIWGGDETIQKIRKISIKPTATELVFADKFSLCMIKSSSYLNDSNQTKIAEEFYNDSFWFNQKACSSSKLVIWIGEKEESEKSRKIFWKNLEYLLNQKYQDFQTIMAIDKFVAECSIAIEEKGQINTHCFQNNFLHLIEFQHLKNLQRHLHCGSGLFFDYHCLNLNEVASFFTRKEQTVTTLGFTKEELMLFVRENSLKGVDRFVKIGKALEFSPIWDGYDLFKEFCREIDIDI